MTVAVAAGTLIGLSLGALGGGGSILAVPVLVHLLDQSAAQATTGAAPEWPPVLALTAAAAAGGVAGARLAGRTDTSRLSAAFTVLVLGVATYTAARALPALA